MNEEYDGDFLDKEPNSFKLIELALHWILIIFDPDYQEFLLDNGSFEVELVTILTYLAQTEWYAYFSEETLTLFGTEVYYIGQQDYEQAKQAYQDWKDIKLSYFWSNLRPVEWAVFLAQVFGYYVLARPGTFSPTSVWLTALPWTIIGFPLNLLQIVFLIFYNKGYAEGNQLLIGIQIFSLIQFLSSLGLSWNNLTYEYQHWFRIWRYISFGVSILFVLIYLNMMVALFDLINEADIIKYDSDIHKIFIASNSLMDDETSWAVYDLFMALFLAYFLITLAPTFLNNLVIALKETTMKQTAWSAEQDYKEGELFGIKTDFLYYTGASEDPEYYREAIKDWLQEYV